VVGGGECFVNKLACIAVLFFLLGFFIVLIYRLSKICNFLLLCGFLNSCFTITLENFLYPIYLAFTGGLGIYLEIYKILNYLWSLLTQVSIVYKYRKSLCYELSFI